MAKLTDKHLDALKDGHKIPHSDGGAGTRAPDGHKDMMSDHVEQMPRGHSDDVDSDGDDDYDGDDY